MGAQGMFRGWRVVFGSGFGIAFGSAVFVSSSFGSLVLSAVFFVGYGVGSFALVALAAIIGGVSIGGENDLMPYLAGRYFGKQAVSKTFGWFLSAYVLGGAIGSVAFVWAMTAYQGPTIPLFGVAALQIVPIVLFLMLGPYPKQTDKVA